MSLRKQKWLERGGLLALFLFLISLAVAMTINMRPLYVFDINYLNILDYTNVDQPTLLRNYDLLMKSLNFPWVSVTSLPEFPMSVAGQGHFVDVKKLFLLDYAVLLLTVTPAILFLRHLWQTKRQWRLIRPFQVGVGIPLIFGCLMALGFDTFFVKFHQLFFSNDDWLFDPATDPIINVLPEAYFMHCFILAFVLIELFFIGMVLLGRYYLKKEKQAN